MDPIIFIAFCFAAGMVCRHLDFPQETGQGCIRIVIYIILPCITLRAFQEIHIAPDLLIPVVAVWLPVCLAIIFFYLLGRAYSYSPSTIGALILGGAFANTSLVGIPLVNYFAGQQYTGLAIWIDQAGTYAALNLIGIPIAALASGDPALRASIGGVLKRIGTFPPFLAMIIALLTRPFDYPEWLLSLFDNVALAMVPFALFGVGFQLQFKNLAGRVALLSTALVFSLVVAPASILFVFVGVLGIVSSDIKVTILEIANGPQIGAAAIALQYRLDPPLVAGIVGIGIAASLITTHGWWWMLTQIGL